MKEVPKDLPPDTTLLDLQNNKITEIKDGDFKNLKSLHVSCSETHYVINIKGRMYKDSTFIPIFHLNMAHGISFFQGNEDLVLWVSRKEQRAAIKWEMKRESGKEKL